MKRLFLLSMLTSLACAAVHSQSLQFPSLEDLGAFDELESYPTTPFAFFEVDPSVFPAQNELFEEVTSITSGEWDSPLTWDCNCVPNSANSVTIMDGHDVSFSLSKEAYTLHIRPEGKLESTQPDLTLTINRDIAVYGAMNIESTDLILDGAEVQRIYGNCNAEKLFFSSTNEIILEGNLFISKELWVGPATFTTSNRAYLTSFEGELAQIAPMFEGTINGEVITSKEIVISENGFISLGTPVSNSTIQTIVDDFLTTGFEGSDFPDQSFNSVRYYVEESDDNTTDYAAVTSSENPMEVGRGYYVFAQAGTHVFNEKGVPNAGTVDLNIDFTNNASPAVDGLNLVSNPFLANLNWDSSEGWTKENLVGALYVWDPSQKQFRTYINGSGVNGGSAIIKPMEAFWVMASDLDPTLEVNEAAKSLYNSDSNVPGENMTVSITNGNFSDELVLTTNSMATGDFNTEFDALKFYGDNTVPNISTLSDDGVRLAINNIPNDELAYDVDMMINIPVAGDYTINISGAETFFNDRCVVIEDLLTEEFYDLTSVEEFSFTSEQVEDQVRFIFHLGTPVTAETAAVQCTGDATGSVVTQGTGDGPWNISWFDADMNLLGETLDETEAFQITGLLAGEYSIQVENNEFCPTILFPVTITEAPEVLQVNHSLWHIDCDEDNTGEILLNLNGGVQPIMVEWDNEMLGANIEDLGAGEYTYTVTDGAGCVRTDMVTINEAIPVTASFETDVQTIILDENNEAVVNFTNTSEGATLFTWDFGDGFTTSTEASLAHTFTQPGFYTVSMYAENGDCDDYFQAVISVQLHVGITETNLIDNVNIVANEGQVVVNATSAKQAQVTVEVYDLLGKTIDSKQGQLGGSHQMILSLDKASALYLVSVLNQSTGERTIRKISR